MPIRPVITDNEIIVTKVRPASLYEVAYAARKLISSAVA